MNDVEREYFMGKAAWAWCASECGHLVMIPELATRMGEILKEEVEKAFRTGFTAGTNNACGLAGPEGVEWDKYVKDEHEELDRRAESEG